MDAGSVARQAGAPPSLRASILGAIAIGIGATLVMDLWNLFLKRTFGIPSLSYCLLGRWVRHMPEGSLKCSPSSSCSQRLASASLRRERPIQRRPG
jgi:hypothetical protein